MLFQKISYLTPDFTVVDNAYIGVTGSRIDYIGLQPPARQESYGRVIDGRGRLLMPGFYNAHSHMAMSLMRGYGENLSLHDWLYTRIFPFEAHLTGEDIYWGTLLGCAEFLRFGGVGCTDMYMSPAYAAKAFAEAGLKANLCVCCSGDDTDFYKAPQAAAFADLQRDFSGYDDGRIVTELSLHAEYTSNEGLVRSLAKAAGEYGARMHVHVSETENEVRECKERHKGQSPVEYLSGCGLFDTPTTAAHCVALSRRDIEILAEKRVSVASCPKSNLKLVSGICPASELLEAGVNVALGTDSVTSNNNLNMLEELRFFTLLQKLKADDPSAMKPAQALYAATRAGAVAQGRSDCGYIDVGYRADLTMLDIGGSHWKPVYELINNLVYSGMGSDVCMTVVDGRILYENGALPGLDMERITSEVEQRRIRILGTLNK